MKGKLTKKVTMMREFLRDAFRESRKLAVEN